MYIAKKSRMFWCDLQKKFMNFVTKHIKNYCSQWDKYKFIFIFFITLIPSSVNLKKRKNCTLRIRLLE